MTVFAAVLRFADLGLQSLWYDETTTAFVLQPSLGDTLVAVRDREATPPLYYALTWLWTRVAGEGDVALRAPSAFFGTLAVPATFLAGARLAGRRLGLVAAALVATSPYLIWYSQEARAYALAALLSALSLVFLARLLGRSRTRTDLFLWAFTCALLFATHYYAAILIVAEAIVVLRALGPKPAVLGSLVVPGVAMAALAPLALDQRGDGRTEWIADLPLDERLGDTLGLFLVGGWSAPVDVWLVMAALLVIGAFALLVLQSEGKVRFAGKIGLGVAALGTAAALGFALVGLDYVLDRNLIVLWIPLAIATAAGLVAAGRPGLVLAALLCVAFLCAQFALVGDETRHRPDWAGAVDALGRPQADRPIILSPGYSDTPLVHYGVPLIPAYDGARVRTRELAVIGEGLDPALLAPGRRVRGFVVRERHVGQLVTSATLTAPSPRFVRLGPVRGTRFGADDVRVVLEAGG